MNHSLFHILPSDKFSQGTIEFYNKTHGINYYFFHKRKSYKYILPKSDQIINICTLRTFFWARKYKFDTVLIHSLSIKNLILISFIKHYKNIIWLVYGNDFYTLRKVKRPIYDYQTKDYLKKKISVNKVIRQHIENRIYNLLFVLVKRKINYISTLTIQEYELINNSYNLKLERHYIPLHDKVRERSITISNSNNLIIGNSCNEWNNHIDVFNVTERLKDYFEKVIVPLSYPKEKTDYKKHIIALGQQKFKEKFMPLTNFIPLNEYDKLFLNCKCAIYNHKRQAAAANVVFALSIGIKVFISPESELFQFLKQMGIIIYKFPEEFIPENIINPLSLEQKKYNQDLIYEKLYETPEIKLERLNRFIDTL